MGEKRFFCDHCGKQVLPDSSKCPNCGRPFRAIKCPACQFKGDPWLFDNGCPRCGYLSNQDDIEDRFSLDEPKKPFRFNVSMAVFWGAVIIFCTLLIYFVSLF